MQAIAAWILARPLHAVLALAATITLSWLSFLSGVVLIFLAIHQGLQRAAVAMSMAAGLMLVVGFVAGQSVPAVIIGALLIWVPSLLLAMLLLSTRSLTLTLQISALLAALAMFAIDVFGNGLQDFSRELLQQVSQYLKENNNADFARQLDAGMEQWVLLWPMAMVIGTWAQYIVMVVLGQKLARIVPTDGGVYGRFRDLNFGRVIASLTLLASAGAFLTDWLWLQNLAFVLFAVFWLQGLALVHWLHAEELINTFLLVGVYVLIVVLNVVFLVGLAVAGYIDAWFGFRRLRPAAS